MGVSLSLDGTRQTRGGKRAGQHTRNTEEQACLDALAAFLRSDVEGALRSLRRVSRASLAARLLPAIQALAQAADMVLASGSPAVGSPELDFVLSPACLLGFCEGSTGPSACLSPACQHDCHERGRAEVAVPAVGASFRRLRAM